MISKVRATPPPPPPVDDDALEPMSMPERIAFGGTGVVFAGGTLHTVQACFHRAMDAGIIGDPHIPTHGAGVALALLLGAGIGVVTGFEMVRAACTAPARKGAPLEDERDA